ncbi:hypothetical protein BBO99_00000274 [Phytophthora kernoviae]|uniref:BZIP domain-containing protein n=1 Tax=Phytophthora kernoviae TaxID=325452 RepID=A0A3R7J938_9STRA|nr:hypothetical protein JM16_002449 [Phytophthora kernoviae]RLN21316.1 hypothetical protein BBI17_000316 [Phytophthora kernoviae]RLN85744.1 hypothetical protein BBO99_00000274 [Phytophthora kernoviae]
MQTEPELEPLAGGGQAASEDSALSDLLAFVDTFPIDSSDLLEENRTNAIVDLVHDDARPTNIDSVPQTKEQRRREANRLKDRNKYLRKKERLPNLRAEVDHLSKILTDRENGRDFASDHQGSGRQLSTSHDIDVGDALMTARQEKERMLVQISKQKNELQVENVQLRNQFHTATVFSSNLQQMLNNEHKLYLANSSYFLVLKPLTSPDCHKELRRSLNAIASCYGAAKNLNRTREICGWNEKRLTERADFHNWKSKILRDKSARFIFTQTWEVFLNPWRTEKLFAPVMGVRCRLVQRVDDDNVLFCYDYAASRVLSEKTDIPVVNTMALVTRISTENGYFIITRGLRRGSVEVQDLLKSTPSDSRSEIWLETLTWIHFEQRGKDCEVTIGGVSPALRSSSYFWMVECVQLALRWEMAVFGPRFRCV